jgi:hypothetical protein
MAENDNPEHDDRIESPGHPGDGPGGGGDSTKSASKGINPVQHSE